MAADNGVGDTDGGAGSVEQRLTALETTVEQWGESVRSALADLGAAIGSALGGLGDAVAAAATPPPAGGGADASTIEAEMTSLRGDLADALDETREQLIAAQTQALDELRESLLARLPDADG